MISKNSTVEELIAYVLERLKIREDISEQLAVVRRRSAVELFRAGHALHLLRDELKATNGFLQCLESNKICRTTAHNAMTHYYRMRLRS